MRMKCASVRNSLRLTSMTSCLAPSKLSWLFYPLMHLLSKWRRILSTQPTPLCSTSEWCFCTVLVYTATVTHRIITQRYPTGINLASGYQLSSAVSGTKTRSSGSARSTGLWPHAPLCKSCPRLSSRSKSPWTPGFCGECSGAGSRICCLSFLYYFLSIFFLYNYLKLIMKT